MLNRRGIAHTIIWCMYRSINLVLGLSPMAKLLVTGAQGWAWE